MNFLKPKIKSFTIVEALIAMGLVVMVGLGLIVCVIMTRQMAEYDKQRISAVAAARRYIEERARRDLFPSITPIDDVTLDDFNTPNVEDDLRATLTLKLYSVNQDGTRGTEITSAPTDGRVIEVEVTVSWNRTASMSSHRVDEVLHTYMAPDL